MYRVVVGNTQPSHLNSRTRRAAIVPKHIVPGYNSAGHDPLPHQNHLRHLRASGVKRQARDLRRKCPEPDRQYPNVWDLNLEPWRDCASRP